MALGSPVSYPTRPTLSISPLPRNIFFPTFPRTPLSSSPSTISATPPVLLPPALGVLLTPFPKVWAVVCAAQEGDCAGPGQKVGGVVADLVEEVFGWEADEELVCG